MPFKSEAQRRYLWANEPEIARDWADTYGSRIEKNEGGIMRLPFGDGEVVDDDIMVKVELLREQYPDKYHEDMVSDEEMVEMVKANEGGETVEDTSWYKQPTLEKMWKDSDRPDISDGLGTMKDWATDKIGAGYNWTKKLPGMAMGALAGIPGATLLMQGLRGPQLTPQQIQMNKNYMANYGVTRDQTTGRMIGGPFAGMNAPGTSAFGSKTSQEMAGNWLEKYGDMNYSSPEQQQKQQTMINLAGKNTGPSPAHPSNQGNNQGIHRTDAGHAKTGGSGMHGGRHYRRGGIAGLWPR